MKNYLKISNWMKEKPIRFSIFCGIYKVIPVLIFLCYGIMLVMQWIQGTKEQFLRIVLVPLVTFLVVSVFRKVLNCKRPYEVNDWEPLIPKNKKGESFPSRHTVSAVIIAMAGLYVNVVFGVVLLVLAAVVAIVRPIAGVHFVKDVIAAIVIAVVFGIVGFWII